MDRRHFLNTAGAVAAGAALVPQVVHAAAPAAVTDPTPSATQPPAFAFEEATAAGVLARMQAGTLTSSTLTAAYLARIAAIDAAGPRLRSVIEVNPDAMAMARERDAERRAGRVRGPLHGLPVLGKDNLDTADRMQTTAGSLALV
ncbi:amidase family protein, partial [Gemmatimonas sp.]|uniref:amidase family protein n=1 Tax=Gemmatimonas sp. TaxID=1962908 RepID=UPI00391F108F